MDDNFRGFLALLWISGIAGSLQVSFVIQNANVVRGQVLSHLDVVSMRECSARCNEMSDCGGFNYLISSDDKAQCLLVDPNKPFKVSELPVAEAVLHSGRKINLNRRCSTRSFAFESFPHMKVASQEIILDSKGSLSIDECLIRCQERSDCRAVQFNRHNATCDVLRASPNTVYNLRKNFVFSDSWSVYENNCLEVPMSSTRCSFMRIKAAGLTDTYDEVVPNVKAELDCEQLCVEREATSDPCRSYTYDSLNRHCYISHQDSRSYGRNPLSTRNGNLVHGSLDDCIDFALKCRNDELEIHGLSMRLFSGTMKTKRKKDVLCERKVSPSFTFLVQMPYKDCGLDQLNSPYPSHSGLVHVKEGSTNLVTIRDKILQVSCRIHSQVDFAEQMLTAQLRVDELNSTNRALTNKIVFVGSEAPRPRYSLFVLNEKGIETDVVGSGEQGWLSLRINDNSENHIFVSNLVARDVNTNQVLNLIGDDGCVTNRGQILGILRPSPGEIRYKVNFDGFDEQAQFVYQALVETCSFDCSPECNEELWLDKGNNKALSENSLRLKRDVGPRQIELTQDIYKIHGGRITMLSSQNSQKQMDMMKLRQGIDVVKETKPIRDEEVLMQMVEDGGFESALRHCFSEDITCLFTVILTSIQVFLLISCVFIVYCYIRQWRSYRSVGQPISTQIQYEIDGEETASKTDPSRGD